MPKEGIDSGEKFVESAKDYAQKTKLNDAQYTVKSIKSLKILEKEVQAPTGTKIKYIAEVLYKNGVTKRRIIGMSKNGKMIFGFKTLTKEQYRSFQTGEPIVKAKKEKKED